MKIHFQNVCLPLLIYPMLKFLTLQRNTLNKFQLGFTTFIYSHVTIRLNLLRVACEQYPFKTIDLLGQNFLTSLFHPSFISSFRLTSTLSFVLPFHMISVIHSFDLQHILYLPSFHLLFSCFYLTLATIQYSI